ncbi:LysR family transcriptional regulator [Roseibium limicola]|uniref:LysR family transcriptional regulator n=1 Tax=Roseibium limicola TaxID=2816037 RepID=A0A939ES98_9HYPH|nr:LysR family transcriptional regulator [Roseibium limicola]MBO0347385.1 LysR family transcriptional regulator [Roseibium limicola]
MTATTPRQASVTYPNLRHLRLLEAAHRLGSLTAAAETILISQPAASQAITRLNSQFGGKLLQRRGNGVFATERGLLVVRRTERVLGLIKNYSQSSLRRLRGARLEREIALENHLTISHVRAVSAVGRMGSFSAAARSLGQTEPNVQRAARELEGILGSKLFVGGVKGMHLTDGGEAIARTANLILKELDSTFEEIREYEGAYDGRVVIGTLPLVRSWLVPEAVVAVSKGYPEATIGILDGTYEDLIHSLESGGIDVLLGALREGFTHPGLEQEVLFEDQLSIVVRNGHPLTSLPEISLETLQQYAWVLPRPGTPTRDLFERLVQSGALPRDTRGCIETGSLVALRGILMDTDYLTIISPRQIVLELEAGLLKVLPVPLKGSARPIGMTTRNNWQPTRLQEDFVTSLRKAVESQFGADD